MPIRDHVNRVAKYKALIVTVDPPTGTLEAVGPDGQVRPIPLFAVPYGFTWPREGEYWSIYDENGYWRLGEKFLSPEERAAFQALAPGETWNGLP
jgi:hypothetical protein